MARLHCNSLHADKPLDCNRTGGNIFEGRFLPVYDDPKRYENDGLYDEDTDYKDEADDSDYIVDDEDEDENALWDDADAEEYEKTRRRLAKEH